MRNWESWSMVLVGLVMLGVMGRSPLAWAQPFEVADSVSVTREVATQMERLIGEAAASDPELARELGQQQELCLHDLSDGQLDNPDLISEIETLREVQTEVTGRVIQAEVEARATALIAQGSAELADDLRTAFTALGVGAMPDVGGPGGRVEPMSRAEARTSFEQVYNEVAARDPQEAARMKEMFEQCERGEFDELMRPTPETMERMAEEMKEYMSDHPEMGEYVREFARAEWNDFTVEYGHEMGDHGPGPGDLERMMGPGFDQEGGFSPEFHHEGPETLGDFYRDMAETYSELMRETDPAARLDLLSDLAVTASDVEQQRADSRYSATLNAAEANLTAAEQSDIKDTGTPLHREAFAEVDPARSGEEHLHIDYTRGTEAPLGTHVDARVDLHDHSTDEIVKTFTHIQDICPSGTC